MKATTGWFSFEEPWFHLDVELRAHDVPTWIAAVHEQVHRTSTITRFGLFRTMLGFAAYCARQADHAMQLRQLESLQKTCAEASTIVEEGLAVVQSLLACVPDYVDEAARVYALFSAEPPYATALRTFEDVLGRVQTSVFEDDGINLQRRASYAGVSAAIARACLETDILQRFPSLESIEDCAFHTYCSNHGPDARFAYLRSHVPPSEVLHELWKRVEGQDDRHIDHSYLRHLCDLSPKLELLLEPSRRTLRDDYIAFVRTWAQSRARTTERTVTRDRLVSQES